MRNRIGRIVVACGVLLLLVPAGASADQGCHNRTTSTTYVFSVNGSNGYRIDVESYRSGKVSLMAEKENRYAEYTVKGRSDEQRLEADFGQLGSISVRPTHKNAVRYPAEPVPLRGRIEFQGEEGFTSISLRATRGVMFRKVKHVCPPAGRVPARASAAAELAGRRGKRVETSLVAAERTASRSVFMRLQSTQPPFIDEDGGDFLLALLEERLEGMAIRRAVDLDEGGVMVAASPVGANPFNLTLTAPSPFSGTASYSRAPGSPAAWAGDLVVSLPGVTNLPLTGPGFSAVACSSSESTNLLKSCEEELEDLVDASLLLPFRF